MEISSTLHACKCGSKLPPDFLADFIVTSIRMHCHLWVQISWVQICRPLDCFDNIQPFLVLSALLAYAGCRSERLSKYNQLLRIEEELGADAVYAGENWRYIGW